MKRIFLDCTQMTVRLKAHQYLARLLDFPMCYACTMEALAEHLAECATLTELVFQNLPDNEEDYARQIFLVAQEAAAKNRNILLRIEDRKAE